MSTALPNRIFAPPRRRHSLTLTTCGATLSIRSWRLGIGIALVATAVVGCIASTTLLFISDDVASAFRNREARTVTAYERRIADLRRELDRMASREHVERQTVAARLDDMLDRQRELAERYDRIEPLIAVAKDNGLLAEGPAEPVGFDRNPDALNAYGAGHEIESNDPFRDFDLRTERTGGSRPGFELPAIEPSLLASLDEAVSAVEDRQLEQVFVLAEAARSKATAIGDILEDVGVSQPASESALGGPFIPAHDHERFSEGLGRLSIALSDLSRLRGVAGTLPVGAPIEHGVRTSGFGIRTDPFLRQRALHAGIDYAAPSGTQVFASAGGTVTFSGTQGGYGEMVQIDHGGGHVSRYAHLSRRLVREGDTVEKGAVIGRVGSTGRSTGPHLHYEVLRSDRAIDPLPYVDAGSRLGGLL